MLIAILGKEIELWKLLVDFYVVFLLFSFFIRFSIRSKKVFFAVIVFVFFLLIYFFVSYYKIPAATSVMQFLIPIVPVVLIIVFMSDIRYALDANATNIQSKRKIITAAESTKEAIVKAAFDLSRSNTGAIMTLEKYNNLDEYSERAIPINSDISWELIENIFVPNTPLHDGAVIIRNDKILCAGAYFVLSANADEKTMGSRHRAALGISEITDSVTVIISEETGQIHIAVDGLLILIDNEAKLMEYLSTFMK